MAERTDHDRRYRNRMLVLIGVLLLSYIAYKGWHISISLDAYDRQQIEGPKNGAAK